MLGWAVSLSSFPRLAVVDAELDFTGADIRPTTRRLTAGGVLGEVALLYGEQLKQSWWSIATSLSERRRARRARRRGAASGRRAGLSGKVGLLCDVDGRPARRHIGARRVHRSPRGASDPARGC